MPRSAVAAADAIVGMAHNIGFVIVGMRLSCGCARRIAGGKVEVEFMGVFDLTGNLKTSEGMRLETDGSGTFSLELSAPLGKGRTVGYAVSPNVIVSEVDFRCLHCPNMTDPGTVASDGAHSGRWFTVNRCIEGRCETLVPNLGVAVVSEGDVCMSASQVLPDAFSYPLSRYRGVELFVNTNVANEREFCLLEEAGVSLDELACKADFAAVFSGDARLQSLMDRAVRAARAGEMAMAKLELLSIFMELGRRDFSLTRPVAFLTRTQLEMARRAHDEVESALAAPHDARDIASRMGISATTLNGCFAKLYGMTIAAYARRRRMKRARELLSAGESVSAAAFEVGYSNPSKFAAAFKRETGVSPSEFRRRA